MADIYGSIGVAGNYLPYAEDGSIVRYKACLVI